MTPSNRVLSCHCIRKTFDTFDTLDVCRSQHRQYHSKVGRTSFPTSDAIPELKIAVIIKMVAPPSAPDRQYHPKPRRRFDVDDEVGIGRELT